MNNRNTYNNKNSKGFYIALSVSLLAVIAATVGITYTTRKIKVDTNTTTSAVDWDNNSYTLTESPANNDSDNVPDDRYTTEEPTATESDDVPETETEPSTQAATTTEKSITCALPMGTKILKDYSNGAMVKSKTMNDWRLHNGVDFSGETGDEIKSVCDGTVSRIYTDAMWGKVVEIQHVGKMTAKYCGFDEINVNEGDIVATEQILGTLGTIPVESADNTHLHLEIEINGETVDPIEALGRENPTE